MEPIKSIGKKLNGNEHRDAIHVAIMPVMAAEQLQAGDWVSFVYGTTNQVKHCNPAYDLTPIGVVDPFFTEHYRIEKGTWVWLFLTPGTITGLRHEWTHPEIDNQQPAKDEHERWLREFADRWRFVYDDMIESASSTDGYITAQGIDLHSAEELGEDHNLFWQHLEAMTGSKFDTEHRGKFQWSCTC